MLERENSNFFNVNVFLKSVISLSRIAPLSSSCYDTIYNIRDTLFGELWKCVVYDSCIFIFSSNYYYLWIQERDGIYLSITCDVINNSFHTYVYPNTS